MSDAKTEIKSDNNVEDASKVSDVPAARQEHLRQAEFSCRVRRRHLPLSRPTVIAATVTLVTFARIPDGDGDDGGVRRRRNVYYVAARAMWCRASSDGAARLRAVTGRSPVRRLLVAAPYVRTHARMHIPACLASSSAKMVDISLPRESLVSRSLHYSCQFPSLSFSRLWFISRMISAVQKGGKSRRRRARNVAVAAITGAVVHVRRGRRRRRPGAGVAREAYVCTTSETMRTAKWRET